MRWRCLLLFLLIASAAALLAGCWSRAELKDVHMILGLGIDRAPSGLALTAQLPIAEKIAGGAAQMGGSPATYVVTLEGPITGAVDQALRRALPGRPDWGHLQIVVASEALAREGMATALDFLVRYPGLRQTARLLVTPERASDILRLSHPLDPISALAMKSSLRSLVREGLAMDSSIIQFSDLLGQPGIDPVLPSVRTGPDGAPLLGPSAVFKDDRLVGWLSQEETIGLAAVRGEATNLFVLLSCRPGEAPNVEVKVNRFKSRISTRVQGGRLAAEVEVKARALLAENACLANITESPVRTKLERLAAAQLRTYIEGAIRRGREFRADVFGFGRELYRKTPAEWRVRRSRWDEELARLPVIVRVELKIDQGGSINRPVQPR